MLLCSEEAARKNVKPGMRLSQARAVCSGLYWRQYDNPLYLHVQKDLLTELIAFSPRVSAIGTGMFLLDASGMTHLGGESKMARNLLRSISIKEYTDGNIGIASSAFASTVAACDRTRRWRIVPAGKENDKYFLGGISISFLPISVEMRETLKGLGIRKMGQLLALSPEEVMERFGAEGMQAYELASGIDHRQPMLPRKEKSFQSSLDMGGPVESLTDTLFVIKAMLGRLTTALEREGQCVDEITACFYSDDELFEERAIKLIRPSNDSKFLLEILRLSLENKLLEREFTGMSLIVSRTVPEAWNQIEIVDRARGGDLYGIDKSDEYPGGDIVSSSSFVLLLERLRSRLGEEVMVYPMSADQYIPEMSGSWQSATAKRGVAEERSEAHSLNYAREMLGDGGLVAGLVLKKHETPVPTLVELKGSRPASLSYRDTWYKVLNVTEPECLSGLWWNEPVRKSYYRALIQPIRRTGADNRLLVMLIYDHERSGWFVEGVFD